MKKLTETAKRELDSKSFLKRDAVGRTECGVWYDYVRRRLGWDTALTCKEAFCIDTTICRLPPNHEGAHRGQEVGQMSFGSDYARR